MIVDVYSEEYEFNCHQCGHAWRTTYAVRQIEDAQGGIWHHYSVAGSPSTSPESELLCPNCKHATVSYKVVDRHRLPASSPVEAIEKIREIDQSFGDNVEYLGVPLSSELPQREQASNTSEPFHKTTKIIVGVDRSPSGLLTLRWAADEALAKRAELEVVAAWEPEVGFGFTATTPDGFEREARRAARDHVTEALGAMPIVPVSIAVHRGRSAHVLVEASRGADLLAVGLHGHGAFFDALLGSVNEYCVRHAYCSVVVVRDRTQTVDT
jgi:nucleotide-binding universal stress UspA family protein